MVSPLIKEDILQGTLWMWRSASRFYVLLASRHSVLRQCVGFVARQGRARPK
jgi:hypothetical protein